MSPICFLLAANSLALIQASRLKPKVFQQEAVPASKSKKDIYDSIFYRSEWTWDDDVREAPYQGKDGKTRAPGYARYWPELTETQKSAIENLVPYLHDEETWTQAKEDDEIIDQIADSVGVKYWAKLKWDEKKYLNHLGFSKWSWNEMVKTRKSLLPVSSEEKQAYKGMRKCTKWDVIPRGKNVTTSHVFTEERFERKFKFGLESKIHGNCQQLKEFFFEHPEAPTWAVYVYPKGDYNGAFCIDEWFCARALTVANFFSIAFVRVGSPEEATAWLKRQQEAGRQIGHLVFAGHGDPYSLQFGHLGSLQTGKDAASLEMLAQAKDMLEKDASVFLDSCKTGSTDIDKYMGHEELVYVQKETLHSFVGRQLAGHHVWGSKISFGNSQLKVSFSPPHGFHAIIDECGQFCDQGIDNQAHSYVFANATDEWAFEYGYSCDNLAKLKDSQIETPQDCLNACNLYPLCVGFTFRPEVRQEDFRCSISADCDGTRAPVQILITTKGRNKIRAKILEKHVVPGLAKSSEVKLRYAMGTFGTVWASMNKEEQQLLDQGGNIDFQFKKNTKDQIIFQHKPKRSRKTKKYWAHIEDDQRPARTSVQAVLEYVDGPDPEKIWSEEEGKYRVRLLDEIGRYLIKQDAIKGNDETKYTVDHTAPKYTKMSAEEDIVFTFWRSPRDRLL